MYWNKVTLIGVGLLGGSLGLALQKRRLARSVVGYVRRTATIREARKVGAVTNATTDLISAVQDAQLIILCTPIAQMRLLTQQMLPSLAPGTIVTDVGSVKGTVVRDLEPLVAQAGAYFIGSHPMAGAEKTGVAWARADLFANAVTVVTPTFKSNRAALAKVARLWKSVGSRVLRLSPDQHDELVSRSSHMPHLVAAILANLVLAPGFPKEQSLLCANGFRDTTRIASGSPEMWRDIALANRRHLAKSLKRFVREMQKVQRSISAGNSSRVQSFLEQAKLRRDEWQGRGATASPE